MRLLSVGATLVTSTVVSPSTVPVSLSVTFASGRRKASPEGDHGYLLRCG
ncbi:MAG: hypothetical protein ABGZ23_25230 [Fuerstiella sp.]